MMRVMVSHFVSDSYKVMTALCLVRVSCGFAGTDRMVLPSKVLLSSLDSDRYVKFSVVVAGGPSHKYFCRPL
jgi:hypothetical protein